MWSENITFISKDVELTGRWYFPVNTSSSNRRPLVVLATGLGGNKDWYAPLVENITGEGIVAFCFDFRGHGESSGICNEDIEWDLQQAIDIARKHPLVAGEKLFLGGQCMGGAMALHKAIEMGGVLGAAIFAPLSEQRVINTPSAWDKVMKAMRDPENPHKVKIDEKSFLKIYTAKNLYHALEERSFPVFISFCTGDKYLSTEVQTEVSRRAGRPGDLVYIKEGGRHTAGYRESFIGKRLCRWMTGVLEDCKGY